MTPPGDGGPAHEDTCPWCGTDIEYHSNCDRPREEWPADEEARVWLTCPNEECPVQPSTLVCKTLEEADAAWARPTTARDAALREEGRAEERADVLRSLRDTAAVALKRIGLPATQRGPKEDYFAAASALNLSADAIERGDHLAAKPAPDASQGSAPKLPLCPRCDADTVGPWQGGYLCASCNMEWDPAPAAPQGSPLPGFEAGFEAGVAAAADYIDGPYEYSGEWKDAKVVHVAGQRHPIQDVLIEVLVDVVEAIRAVPRPPAPARNPPEGGALEGERTAEQERSALIDFINGAYEFDEAEGEWGGWRLVPHDDVKDLTNAFTPSDLADSVCVDLIRRIEAGDHLPAIPQSGDEKEGTDGE